ncbi:flagellin [Phosphitispora fastidiosa]|uniref:flagellin N-terminal helical domain-containing protein n=1 Tax=Phosphitispora fastidiosa TaxID=2837202 RepID=UPI001E5C03C7|nr:flagellin [Phosphitispora fastidiosa]MBU7006920.1 flagellin [Phosphitispora fastidiosa]
MRINHNTAALFSYNRLKTVTSKKNKFMGKLSSGKRINKAGDDAAGLGISEKMRSQIRGMRMAARNAQDAVSLIQTAEGALNEQHSILQRMRELTVQAASDINTREDRGKIELEVAKMIDELERITIQTEFNTKKIFLGADADPYVFQVGANEGHTLELNIKRSLIPSFGYFVWEASGLIAGGPGSDRIIDLSDSAKAEQFLRVTDKAIADVSNERSNLGSTQNRLESVISNLRVAEENLTAAESRIRDTDIASSMVQYTKSQIIEQASLAMLAQANRAPQGVLQLLGD